MSEPASWLVEERRRLGLSRVQLAARLGVASSTVARWERDERRVAHPSMLRLALEGLALEGLARRGVALTSEALTSEAHEARARGRHAVTWRLWRAAGGH